MESGSLWNLHSLAWESYLDSLGQFNIQVLNSKPLRVEKFLLLPDIGFSHHCFEVSSIKTRACIYYYIEIIFWIVTLHVAMFLLYLLVLVGLCVFIIALLPEEFPVLFACIAHLLLLIHLMFISLKNLCFTLICHGFFSLYVESCLDAFFFPPEFK